MKTCLFIYNSKAGHGQIRNDFHAVVSGLNQNGYLVTAMETQYRGHCEDLIREYGSAYDVIVISGGDGTLNEACNGYHAMEKKVPLSYIPTGTTNDSGANLGISKDVKECVNRIVLEDAFTIDLGKLNKRCFFYVAAFGTPVKVTYTTPQSAKKRFGYAAYVYEFLKLLPETQSFHLRLTVDGKPMEGDYCFGLITNAISVSGFKGVTGRDVSLNDGRFEVLLVKSVRNIGTILPKVPTLFQDNVDSRYFERLKAEKIEILSDKTLDWCLDGEYGGSFVDTSIQVLPGEITFYV